MNLRQLAAYREYPTPLRSVCAANLRYWRRTHLIKALRATAGLKPLDVDALVEACKFPRRKPQLISFSVKAGAGRASILAPSGRWIADVSPPAPLDLKLPHSQNAPWCFVMFWGKTPRPKQRCGVFFCHRAVSHVYKKGVRGVFGRGVFQKRHKNQKHHVL